MAKNQAKRLSAKLLQADIESYQALLAIPDYSPANPEFKLSEITATFDNMNTKQTTEVQIDTALAEARDNAVASEWAFHNKMLGTKDQVKAQYGSDSTQLQAVGLKRKSEYKKPQMKSKGV